MKIKFLGAAKCVTGSFFVIDTIKGRFAVDCGLFQGSRVLEERNQRDFEIEPQSIDFLIVTHAHIDHIGLIPKLCKEGFKGRIYCSHATRELAAVMLPDSGHIQEADTERLNRKNKRAGKPLVNPVYTTEDALNCLGQFRSLNTDEIIEITPEIKIRLRDAGHILGACIIEIWVEEDGNSIKIVFSGDLGHYNQPIIKDPAIIESADYVIMESTYGNRLHPSARSRKDDLKEVIKRAMQKGGNLIIPAFAVERTQDLLYDLYELSKQGDLDPDIEIYLDSPLAIEATRIFQRYIELYDDEARKILEEDKAHPLMLEQLKFSHTKEDSMLLNSKTSNTIIISASGMCEAGRIKHHLKNNIWRPEATILFVGYQAQGTLGRRILDGEKLVKIFGEQIAVKAEIANIEAYSAHADQQALLEWLGNFGPDTKGVFLVHGEEESQLALAGLIEERYPYKTYIPDLFDEFELEADNDAHKMQHRQLSQEKLAAMADKAYLNLCLHLQDMYRNNVKESNYQQILELTSRIGQILIDNEIDNE